VQRIPGESGFCQATAPLRDESHDGAELELLVRRGVFFEIGSREVKERPGRTETVLLQMDKCRGELNQPFVKRPVGTESVFEPEAFEHLVRFEITGAIEALEKAKVTRIKTASTGGGGE
jgi:hypothetical protein